MTEKIPFVDLSLQHAELQTELDAVTRHIIQTGQFILGTEVASLEQEFAQASGVQHGIGVGCGTDAIALGLRACGIGAGDEVLVPANTFIATVIGVLQAGAQPVLVDCQLGTALMDLDAAARSLTRKTRAIIPVHLYGQLVEPQAVRDFAQAHDLITFEDAAQAHLAHRDGVLAGQIGSAAAYSFYPSKNLGACGDGGMVLTNDDAIAHRVRCYRNYGTAQKYTYTEWGINSRLDGLQAAILRVKLPHLSKWNQQRNTCAAAYDRGLAPLRDRGLIPMQNQSGTGHIYHLYVVRVTEAAGLSRDQVAEKLRDRGIFTGIHYPIPCHLQPAYAFLGYAAGDFPVAEQLANEILSLPMYPGLPLASVQRVVAELSTLLLLPSF